MRELGTHHRKLKAWRQNVSLLLVVIWLSVLIQPCVMAATTVSAETEPETTGHIYAVGDEKTSCTHCSTMLGSCDLDDFNSSHSCLESESAASINSIAAIEQNSKVEKVKLFAIGFNYLADARLQPASDSLTIPPGLLHSGPSIIDLFQVYLN